MKLSDTAFSYRRASAFAQAAIIAFATYCICNFSTSTTINEQG